MSPDSERRPGVGPEAPRDSLTTPRVPDADADRARCCACHHPLTSPRSLARGFGPECWRRTARAQLDARRDAAGHSLAALARRVALADAEALDLVAVALLDVADALDRAGVPS